MNIGWGIYLATVESMYPLVKKWDISVIVGISRGGLIPATMIAHNTDTPLAVAFMKSYSDGNKQKKLEWDNQIHSLKKLRSNARLLIVDDIADSGATIAALKKKFPNAKVAVVCKKKNCLVPVDFYGKETDDWVTFPYEVTKV